MDWSNETVCAFLKWYENENVIWNTSHPNHKNRNEVFDAWKRIEIKLNKKYSITELKKKKDSLMASFRACLSKVKQSIKSGAGTETLYHPNWFAYEQMASFLKDKVQPRETINSEAILSQKECENAELEDISGNTPKNRGLVLSNIENDAVVLPLNSKTTFKTPLRKKMKVDEANELKKKMNSAYSILQSSVQKHAKKRDVCDIYGELVAAKLKLMDEESRDISMNRIDNILFEMKMNYMSSRHFLNPGTSQSPSP